MRFLRLFLLTISGYVSAQEAPVNKPRYVIIANDRIISEKEMNQYAEAGYVKSMNKGVSEEERNRYADLFGSKIGEKEFIITIGLFTQEEVEEKAKNPKVNIPPPSPSSEFRVSPGEKAPDFTLTMLDGTRIHLKDLRGKVILLNFWATWCAPCLMEFYDIPEKILLPFQHSDFVFIPVSIGEEEIVIRKRMEKLNKDGIVFNVGGDKEKHIWNQYAEGGIPKNLVIDKQGLVRYISSGNGEDNLDNLYNEIQKLL